MPDQKQSQVKKVRVNFVRSLPLSEKTCPHCAETFMGVTTSVYCSDSCKGRANYAAHADMRRATRRAKYQRQQAAITTT